MSIDPPESVNRVLLDSAIHSYSPLTLDIAYQNAYDTLYQALTVVLRFMPEDEFHTLIKDAREAVARRLESELSHLFGTSSYETFNARPEPLE